MKLKHICLALLFLIAALVCYALFPGPNNQETNILVAKGSSKAKIAAILASKKIIYLPKIYWALEQVLTLGSYIQAGEYAIPAEASPLEIITMMKHGEIVIRKVTIPEGFTTYQAIETVKNDPNLKGVIETHYKEGDFLPNTYFYTLGDTKQQMLDKMHKALNEALEELWPHRTSNSLTKQQILILASIIEKETKFDDERQLVAAVFYNRLKKGIRLQADPTTIYAITKGKYILDRALSKKDLQINSSFNTYMTFGLPPTPIANSGIESIKAALNPATVDYLYFVANSKGKHSFSLNLVQHNKYVRSYRKVPNH